MIVTIRTILDSVAEYLQSGFEDIPVYAGENQQGTEVPCFFITLTNPEIKKQASGFWMREIGLDVVYLQQREELNSNLKLYAVQEWMDEHMGIISLTDGMDTVQAHAYEREASVQDQDLHYKFRLRARVYIPDPKELMREMEEMNVRRKEESAGKKV